MAPTKRQNHNQEPLLGENHQENVDLKLSAMPGIPMYLPTSRIPIPEMSFFKETTESITEPYDVPPPPKIEYVSQWYPQQNPMQQQYSHGAINILPEPAMSIPTMGPRLLYSNNDGTVVYPIQSEQYYFQPQQPQLQLPQPPQQPSTAPAPVPVSATISEVNEVSNPPLDKAIPLQQMMFVRTVLTIVNIQIALMLLSCYVIHIEPEIAAFLKANEMLVIPVVAEGAAALALLIWCPDMGICSVFNMILFLTLSFSQSWIVATFAATTNLQLCIEAIEIVFGFTLALWIYAGIVQKEFSHLGASLTVILTGVVFYSLAMNYEYEVAEKFNFYLLGGVAWALYVAHVIVSTVQCSTYIVRANNFATGIALIYTYLPVIFFATLCGGRKCRRPMTPGRVLSV